MKLVTTFLIFLFVFVSVNTQSEAQITTVKSVTHTNDEHEAFDQLLRKYVSSTGKVDYEGLSDHHGQLKSYIRKMGEAAPSRGLSKYKQLAYWINLYNAATLDLVLSHYPLKSIRDIDDPWDIAFVEVEGEKYSLNNIEHDIIRERFDEPRIHFAVNCAAVSCPKLRNEAYTADQLKSQLDDQADFFINKSGKNNISAGRLELSKIFKWYKGDFTKNGSLNDFIADYTAISIDKTDITYLEYNWSLNDK